jgi:tetratricopeptide (TPR) repeat protein
VFVALAAVVGLLILAVPSALWAYEISRAGALVEHGLAWPTPRYVDSLPALRDDAALDKAQTHLANARRYRPNDPHADRLLGYVMLARGDWERAATAFNHARSHAPRNPLIAWEAALAYEQLYHINPTAPTRASLREAWRAAGISPTELLRRAEEAHAAGRRAEAETWRARAATAAP